AAARTLPLGRANAVPPALGTRPTPSTTSAVAVTSATASLNASLPTTAPFVAYDASPVLVARDDRRGLNPLSPRRRALAAAPAPPMVLDSVPTVRGTNNALILPHGLR